MAEYPPPPKKKAKTFDKTMIADNSSQSVAEPFKEDIIVEEKNSFKCTICLVSMTGSSSAKSHLQGAKHKRAVQNSLMQAASQPNPFCDNADSPSSDVLAAIKSGQVVSENVGNITRLICVPCSKECTGEVPMSQHLLSDAHAKKIKKENQSLRSSPHQEASVTAVMSNTNTSIQFDSVSSINTPTVQGDEVSIAVMKKIVSPAEHDQNHLRCLLCNINCTGKEAMRDHLKGKLHAKNEKKLTQLLKHPNTTTEMMVETPASDTIPEVDNIISPPPQFLDSSEVQSTATQDMKCEVLGLNLESVPASDVIAELRLIPDEDFIKDIRIYKPDESLSDLFEP